VELPAGFGFSFTGMDVRHADAAASVFHGIGIVPDVEVPLDAASFAAGEDPELVPPVRHVAGDGQRPAALGRSRSERWGLGRMPQRNR
jgi:hypothetical protein